MVSLALAGFTAHGVRSAAADTFIFPSRDGLLHCAAPLGTLGGEPIVSGKYLVIDLTNMADISCPFGLNFYTAPDGAPNPDTPAAIGFKIGLLPHLRTRVALPLAALDGGILFLPRTPGRLKTTTNGHPVDFRNVAAFALTIMNAPREIPLQIHEIFISDGEPEYPVPATAMVDELGQKQCTDWPGKTADIASMIEFLRAEENNVPAPAFPGRSAYGGDTRRQFPASGYFALHHDGKRYWLADPDGCAFFSAGLDCVGPDGGCNLRGITSLCTNLPPLSHPGWIDADDTTFSWHVENLYRAFGNDWFEHWADLTKKRMEAWGFNTVACWSSSRYIRRSGQPFVYYMYDFPETAKNIFRDFPDVFAPEYAAAADRWSEQLLPYAANNKLIGYFMSNEPNWAFVNDFNPAKHMLAGSGEFVSRERLIEFVEKKYGTAAALNDAWGSAYPDFAALRRPADTAGWTAAADNDLKEFSREMVREYIRIPALAARKAAPHHLNLGIRYAWLSSEILAAGSEFIDVFSINCYAMDPTESIDRAVTMVGKPVILGEFHFGALDRGLDATGIRGVTSQEERGKAYRYYLHRAAAHPYCLGAHYFTLNDQGYLGRFDGENYQIGLVDVCNRPYYEFDAAVTRTHGEIYDVAAGTLPPTTEAAEEIPPIFY